MLRSSRLRAAALVVLVPAFVLAAALPAAAESQTVKDPRDDGRWDSWGEIYSMTADHTDKNLKIRGTYDAFADLHEFLVFVPGEKKWSFLLHWYTEGSVNDKTVYVYARGEDGERCSVETARSSSSDGVKKLSVRVPRRCLETDDEAPEKLKVVHRTHQYAAPGGAVDKTRSTGWLSAG